MCFMMMSLSLVNDLDGIWHPSNFIAGDWEISLGRGLQRYADRARFGIVSDSFNSMITIFLFAIANAVILMKFNLNNIIYRILFIIIAIANPVVCNTLSYSYMSVNFGLGYLFSVISFACITCMEKNWKKVLVEICAGGIFLAISMAFYQAYICVTCLLVVLYTMQKLLENRNVKKALSYIGVCAGAILIGGVFYLLITKALLYRAGIQLASYKGASGANLVSMIRFFPQSLRNCFLQFGNYLFEQKAMSNLEFMDVVVAGLCGIYLLSAVIQFFNLLRSHWRAAALFLMMVILLPVASCAVLLIAVNNAMTGLMSIGLVMCMVLLGIMVPAEGKFGFWFKRIYLCILLAFAWFQFSAVINDQLAFKEGKTATITLTENIISELYQEKYLDEYRTVAFVGRPGNNDRFAQSAAYQMANEYAKFGCWSTDVRNNRVSWEGIVSNFLGVNINICGDSEYRQIIMTEQVADMPEFPSEGSICIINDIIVVKVSELYR